LFHTIFLSCSFYLQFSDARKGFFTYPCSIEYDEIRIDDPVSGLRIYSLKGIAIARDGSIFMSTFANSLWRSVPFVSLEYSSVHQFRNYNSTEENVSGIAVDESDRVYTVSYKDLKCFEREKILWTKSLLDPGFIRSTNDGRLVTFNQAKDVSNFFVVDANGEISEVISDAKYSGFDIDDRNGNIIVCDRGAKKIAIFDRNCNLIRNISGDLADPWNLAVDGNGNFVVVNIRGYPTTDELKFYDNQGNFLFSHICTKNVWDLTFDLDGNLLTTDEEGIKVYTLK
jgi:hypothetical protein